jgi:thiol-disulfide isomerase/thioredoxin
MKNISDRSRACLLALGVFALLPLVHGEPPALKVGDPAPKLQTGRWIQGQPIQEFEKGKAYIVEFWATWCGPCRTSIPHLNELHEKFKDKGLVVIGQDCWEQDESKVEPFVKQMGQKMTYRVALDAKSADSPKGQMAETWMAAAEQNGIPTAFVVDPKGVLAWVGHPMGLNDALIEGILNGTHDLAKAVAAFERARQEMQEWRAAQVPIGKVREAIRNEDWDQAYARLAEAEKTLSKDRLEMLRAQILLARRDYPALETLAEKLFHPAGGSAPEGAPSQLNELAWRMALDERISKEDLRRAEKLAQWADDGRQI